MKFSDKLKNTKKKTYNNLEELFYSRDRESSHSDLRNSQSQAFSELDKRRSERDIVLKVSTGAGKTTIGLTYLFSFMEQYEEPAVYFCPTIQLVNQVLQEAEKLGIPAVEYPANQPQPAVTGLTGKSVIVCTYDKLFNAKTTFDRGDVELRPCAMVFDDAHAGVEEIKDSFTLRIEIPACIDEIKKLLGPQCSKHLPIVWRAIEQGNRDELYEVPYWIWDSVVTKVSSILEKHKEEKSFIFTYPYLRDILRWCRCVISSNVIEIAPELPPVQMVKAFESAKHRLFMSATLADDSVLVRELNCDEKAAQNPITPHADRGLGERMVLTPSLTSKSFDRTWVMKLCKQMSEKYKIVVLCASEKAANDWAAYGAVIAVGDKVEAAVEDLRLRSSSHHLYCFVQRYDGIDLPDSSCRILVIDGLPYGEGLIQRADSQIQNTMTSHRNRLIYRIEQGMGRPVRSNADYAVVLLAGRDLGAFIAKKEVQNSMNPDAQLQMKLALNLTEEQIKEAGEDEDPQTIKKKERSFKEMIVQCLRRDDDWKQYYNENVREPAKDIKKEINAESLLLATAERTAFNFALKNSVDKATEAILGSISKLNLPKWEKAYYQQKTANYMFRTNKAKAMEFQTAAYEANDQIFAPPNGIVIRPKLDASIKAADRALHWFLQFENPNGAILVLEEVKSKLVFNTSKDQEDTYAFEEAFKDLGIILGAESTRPEKLYQDGGPDNLWLLDNIHFVIEVKSQNEKSIHKKDSGQLHNSCEWYGKNYPLIKQTVIPIIVASVDKVDKGAVLEETARILLKENLEQLLENTANYLKAMVKELPIGRNGVTVQKIMSENKLLPAQMHYYLTRPKT
ncbi:DEAD/DEAH box helicase [Bdellovibrio bacteriovorus]|uniref:DEAD/DEAH box helicase n=1 Tax=Bdellovibrio bacteriovorus TaxID=959 RepID=UPI0035A67B72